MPEINDPTSRLFAARIREARIERDWSLVELAARLPEGHGTKLTGPLIGRIENGARAVSLPELDALAGALGVAVDWLTRAGELCGSCGQEISR